MDEFVDARNQKLLDGNMEHEGEEEEDHNYSISDYTIISEWEQLTSSMSKLIDGGSTFHSVVKLNRTISLDIAQVHSSDIAVDRLLAGIDRFEACMDSSSLASDDCVKCLALRSVCKCSWRCRCQWISQHFSLLHRFLGLSQFVYVRRASDGVHLDESTARLVLSSMIMAAKSVDSCNLLVEHGSDGELLIGVRLCKGMVTDRISFGSVLHWSPHLLLGNMPISTLGGFPLEDASDTITGSLEMSALADMQLVLPLSLVSLSHSIVDRCGLKVDGNRLGVHVVAVHPKTQNEAVRWMEMKEADTHRCLDFMPEVGAASVLKLSVFVHQTDLSLVGGGGGGTSRQRPMTVLAGALAHLAMVHQHLSEVDPQQDGMLNNSVLLVDVLANTYGLDDPIACVSSQAALMQMDPVEAVVCALLMEATRPMYEPQRLYPFVFHHFAPLWHWLMVVGLKKRSLTRTADDVLMDHWREMSLERIFYHLVLVCCSLIGRLLDLEVDVQDLSSSIARIHTEEVRRSLLLAVQTHLVEDEDIAACLADGQSMLVSDDVLRSTLRDLLKQQPATGFWEFFVRTDGAAVFVQSLTGIMSDISRVQVGSVISVSHL